jgi:hypothetical protein
MSPMLRPAGRCTNRREFTTAKPYLLATSVGCKRFNPTANRGASLSTSFHRRGVAHSLANGRVAVDLVGHGRARENLSRHSSPIGSPEIDCVGATPKAAPNASSAMRWAVDGAHLGGSTSRKTLPSIAILMERDRSHAGTVCHRDARCISWMLGDAPCITREVTDPEGRQAIDFRDSRTD